MQRDPIGYYDSINLYKYVNNNPGTFLDPYGLQTAPAEILFIAITLYVLVGYVATQTCPPQQIPVFDWRTFLIPYLASSTDNSIGNTVNGEGEEPAVGDGRTKQDAEDQAESIRKAKENALKSRPSIKDEGGEWEGSGKRPKQDKIRSDKKSDQRDLHEKDKKYKR